MRRWRGVVCVVAVALTGWALVAGQFFGQRGRLLGAELNDAVRYGDTARVRALLARWADPDSRDPNGFRGMPSYGVGYRPLHWAAQGGSVQMADPLLDAGADINCRNDSGETPLHMAAGYYQADMVAHLIDRGADPDARDQGGCTPLHDAARMGRRPIADVLKKRGSEVAPGSPTDPGESPLNDGGIQRQRATVEALLDGGADVNAKDDRGWTPLREATAGVVHYIM